MSVGPKSEIGSVFDADGKLYPVEAKLSATSKKDRGRHFPALDRRGERGDGAVVRLCRDLVPIDRNTSAVPVGFI